MTMTDLNRTPARVARMAENEDVIITERGVPRLRLTKVDTQQSLRDRLIEMGVIVRPSTHPPVPFVPPALSREEARAAIEEWERERDREY